MLKFVSCLTFVIVLTLSSVSWTQKLLYNGFLYNYLPQNYYIVPLYNQRHVTNSFGQNQYTGAQHLNGPLLIDPGYWRYGYGNYIPLTPVPIPNNYIPIVANHHQSGAPQTGIILEGSGRPTHPDYRPPTQWSRLWPPVDWNPALPGGGVDDGFGDNSGANQTNSTTERPETSDAEEDKDKDDKNDDKK